MKRGKRRGGNFFAHAFLSKREGSLRLRRRASPERGLETGALEKGKRKEGFSSLRIEPLRRENKKVSSLEKRGNHSVQYGRHIWRKGGGKKKTNKDGSGRGKGKEKKEGGKTSTRSSQGSTLNSDR